MHHLANVPHLEIIYKYQTQTIPSPYVRAQSASGENMQPIALFLALVFITLGLSNTVPLNGQTTVDGTSQRPVCLLLRYVYRGKCPSLFSVSASEVSGTFLSRYRVGYSMKNVQIFIIVDLR